MYVTSLFQCSNYYIQVIKDALSPPSLSIHHPSSRRVTIDFRRLPRVGVRRDHGAGLGVRLPVHGSQHAVAGRSVRRAARAGATT